MGNVLKITRDVQNMSDLPVALGADPWQAATDAQRRTAEMRAAVIKPLAELVENGSSIRHVTELFMARVAADNLDPHTKHALACLGRDGEAPSVPTIRRMLSAYKSQGINGLLPKHTGRVRSERGWELRATQLYNSPSKPSYSGVASRLRFEGFADATETRVKAFLKALPATLGEHSPARVGKHLHKLKRQHFQRRHLNDVLVGEIYAGDGHTADCYVGHPNTGKPFRPELTVFIDIKSRKVTGWWLTEAESAVSTLFALSHAMTTHKHVPAWLYIDRGAGYRAKLLSDESTGFYARFEIKVIGAIPGNPHGKGWIERFFRTVRDLHDKFFMGGQVYCGDDAAPETNRRLSAELAQGKRTLPSLQQYIDSFTAWLEHYHNSPMEVLNGRTPNQVWAELTPVEIGLEDQAVVRPHELRKVHRQEVRIHNRHYHHEALALFDAKEVDVEYDLHDDRKVWIFDKKGRFLCEAKKVNTIGVLPISRLEEQRDKRLAGQEKRLQRHVDEAKARRQDVITADDQVKALEDMSGSFTQLTPTELTALPKGEVIDVDILKWRQD